MDEIQKLVIEIGEKLQKLEELLQENEIESVNIRFPRGVIRKAVYFRQSRIWFLRDSILKRNLSYHLQLTDVYRWILNRFDIGLTGREMLIKEGLSLFANIIAAIIISISGKIINVEKIGFQRATTVLVKNNIIDSKLKKDLLWLWGIRCKEHVESIKDWELQKYSLNDYNRAVEIWHTLIENLKKARREGKI